jgi:hypothetical protein
MSDPIAVSRRLVAVFAADVEAYSRLMGADEVGTLFTRRPRQSHPSNPDARLYGLEARAVVSADFSARMLSA